MRSIRLPDAHLPDVTGGWTCQACSTAWPCTTAADHLTATPCSCGRTSYWEKRGPRNWHPGERCYTPEQGVAARVADQAKGRAPHFPPSHYYPPKPRRPKWPQPEQRHAVAGAGDIRPGTWTWVEPGGLHPGWGDIHHLAMIVGAGTPKCLVWLILDGTVHDVQADRLILSGGPRDRDRPAWWSWTVAEHLAHRDAEERAAAPALPVQPGLFEDLTPV
ncbi:hypothetical protein [Streptomyces sp. NPDC047070]|uniref:hypothetical protein n=1 Tax=Streptomyces sp. NPDC047070 TaxID=3154923 RepID=UPI003453B7DB